MTTLTISIIVVFVLGYALIATESLTKVNKAAIALLMLVGCWTLYMMDPMQYLQLMHPDYTGGAAGMVEKVTGIIQEHLGDTATTLFFLMGAMTIVEIVDQNGGFNWVRKVMKISAITPAAVINPLFQSMMVVTSPIGEKAPPELAAMMPEVSAQQNAAVSDFTEGQRKAVFWLGRRVL